LLKEISLCHQRRLLIFHSKDDEFSIQKVRSFREEAVFSLNFAIVPLFSAVPIKVCATAKKATNFSLADQPRQGA